MYIAKPKETCEHLCNDKWTQKMYLNVYLKYFYILVYRKTRLFYGFKDFYIIRSRWGYTKGNKKYHAVDYLIACSRKKKFLF